jgi:uncharacterized protein YbbK (DUF523 family)
MIRVSDRPRIGVSACLLGERVRYNGGDKRHSWLVDVLGAQVEWVAVCPEVEAGLGTPRPPMNLARDGAGRLVLVTDRVREDLTTTMNEYSASRAEALAAADLDGYVLKAGSPSCGMDVPVEQGGRTRGLFAARLVQRLSGVPVVDEQQLSDDGAREAFVERVFAHYRERTCPVPPR